MGEPLSKLKRRSGASYRSRLLEPLELFLDRALGKYSVAEALRKVDNVKVHIHEDHFQIDESDHIWLPKAVANGWVILTKDKRIRHRALERDALISAGAYSFILTSGDMKGEDMGAAYSKAIPRVRHLVARYEPPLIATVTQTGIVSVL